MFDNQKSYADSIIEADPAIELQHTGGGCTALVKTLAHGAGWMVLTNGNCSAPENESESADLCIYRYSPDGWGSTGDEKDWQFIPIESAAEGVEIMLAAQADPHAQKRFVCYWGEAYPPVNHSYERVKDFAFFHYSAGNGFTKKEMNDIAALEIGRALTIDKGMLGEHVTIVREK